MRRDSTGIAKGSRPGTQPLVLLPTALLLASVILSGCNRSSVAPTVIPFQSQPALPTMDQPLGKAPSNNASKAIPQPVLPPIDSSMLAHAQAIAARGGLITDLPAMARQLEASSFQIQVIPRSSQEKADRLALEWASDARQLYVIWAYWKLPALSITRHSYYSPSKGKALKVEFTLSSLFSKTFEEPADGFDQASLILNEARDRHAFGVKDAHAIAKRIGYTPNKYGAAVLLDLKTHGPMWVFADMPSQTQGEPVMLVNAESGMVTQGGEALMLARYLFERAGY
ncbi:hypothetical protein D3C72_177770 [compost metagenome]